MWSNPYSTQLTYITNYVPINHRAISVSSLVICLMRMSLSRFKSAHGAIVPRCILTFQIQVPFRRISSAVFKFYKTLSWYSVSCIVELLSNAIKLSNQITYYETKQIIYTDTPTRCFLHVGVFNLVLTGRASVYRWRFNHNASRRI